MKKYVYIKAINKDSKKIINNFFGTNNSEIEYIKSLKNLNLKGMIFIDELSSLGNTMYQIIGNIMEIINKEITIHIIKEKLSFQGKNKSLSFSELELIAKIEKEKIETRLKKAKKTMNDKSKNQGRKAGKKTKSVFDKHKRKILKELKLEIPKVRILENLKQIDISLEKITIQALTAYIKRKTTSQNKSNFEEITSKVPLNIDKKKNYFKFIKNLAKSNNHSN